MEKLCSRCLLVKDVGCFDRRFDRPGLYKSHCKACRLEYKRSVYVKRPRKARSSRTEEEKKLARAAARKRYKEKRRAEKPPTVRQWWEYFTPEQRAEMRREKRNAKQRAKRARLGVVPKRVLSADERKKAKAAARKNRKVAERGADGRFSAEDIERIHKAQKYRCVICRCDTRESRHIDHIVPLASGGSNWPENLQILCPRCNIRKSNKDPVEFMQEVGFLL